MSPLLSTTLRIAAAWLALIIISLLIRPLLPIDETRYLSVAWEMWSGGNFLVPHLNGATYSHKPPLLFWLIDLSWRLFGVNEWSARLISPLFGLATLLLTAALAQQLWPKNSEPTHTSPWILFGASAWTLYSTATMFDMMLAFFAVVAAWGIYLAWLGTTLRGWLVLIIAIGGGMLAKGPAIFVHLLPLALFAPLWAAHPPVRGWHYWYLALSGALLAGTAIALLWAVPAALAGGPAYSNEIFWGQTAGRVLESFAHQRPWWWHLPLLPLLLFPWLTWSRLWRSFNLARIDQGERFCLVWCISTLVIFSLISGKQGHYLLPAFPPFALFVARRISHRPPAVTQHWGIGVSIIIIGVLSATLPYWQQKIGGPIRLADLSPLWGALIATIGMGVCYWQPRQNSSAVTGLSLTTISIVAVLHLGVISAIAPAYNLSEVAQQLAVAQREGKSIAYSGKYQAEYHFLGRLTKPLVELQTESEIRGWAQRNHDGIIVIAYGPTQADVIENKAIYSQDYRSGRVALMPASAYLDH